MYGLFDWWQITECRLPSTVYGPPTTIKEDKMKKEPLSFQERKSVFEMISSIVVTVGYFWYVFRNRPDIGLGTDELLVFWAKKLLIFIPVAIVAKIILHIFFAIGIGIGTRQKYPETDERDKMIELRASRNSHYIFGLSFIAGLAALAMNMSVSTLFIITIAGGLLSGIVECLFQIYYYRRGV